MLNLSPKQIETLREPLHDYNILSGVTGSGKSFIANLKFYHALCDTSPQGFPPNSLGLISGNTADSLYDNVISKLLEIDRGLNWVFYKSIGYHRRVFVPRKNIQIIALGANDEGAQDKVQGKNLSFWMGDEIVKHEKTFVDMAGAMCRKQVNGKIVRSPIMWTCNPDHPSHFIKKDYIDKGQAIDAMNWFYGFMDNPTMTPEYIEKLKALFSGVFYQRMILGLWTSAEGAIYDKFDRALHCIDSIPEKSIVEYVLGIDWGYGDTLAMILMAIDGDGVYYCIDEIYGSKIQIDGDLKKMMEARGWFDLPLYRFNGIQYQKWTTKPAFAYADSNRPDCIAMFQKLTDITTFPAVKDDKLSMIQAVQRKYIPIRTDKDGKQYFGIYYLLHKVPKMIEEKESYRWLEKRGLTKDEPVKEFDHAQDAEQYVIYTRERSRVRFF